MAREVLLLLRVQERDRHQELHPARTGNLLRWLLWGQIRHPMRQVQQGNPNTTIKAYIHIYRKKGNEVIIIMNLSAQIITSGGVTYKNEPWHRDCFTCSHCSQSLAGQRFTSRDDKPYCADCFGELFAKRCTACTKPITGEYPDATKLCDNRLIPV